MNDQQMIDEEAVSSYGEEEDELGRQKEKQETKDVEMADEETPMEDDPQFNLGYFDEFGQFKYNKAFYDAERDNYQGKQKRHIDLKDLSEKNFVDLIADKNQDKRFYGWLHFHPLFEDEEDWGT
mmetsp:Transcript_14565/g.24858  ORF Transcript_14565/g.24858 Transcript_14565/m.24858 type:complete len:124 (+) Transcript_14565:1790-2161(+)